MESNGILRYLLCTDTTFIIPYFFTAGIVTFVLFVAHHLEQTSCDALNALYDRLGYPTLVPVSVPFFDTPDFLTLLWLFDRVKHGRLGGAA